jgi:NAD(P)-dependent dehydrogenase (short-subunit alcohol dehydrogenase family)
MTKVVLITGCSTGIGRDLAQRLAQADYTVVATARNLGGLDGLQVALKLPLDITQPASVTQAVDTAIQQFDRIDDAWLPEAMTFIPTHQVELRSKPFLTWM